MYEEQRLKTVVDVIQSYRFQKPLSVFLREIFRAHRGMGSTDRRIVSQCVYSFFRLGKALASYSVEEKTAVGTFLCTEVPDAFYSWLVKNHTKIQDEISKTNANTKLRTVKNVYPDFSIEDIFPGAEFLSPEIKTDDFILSMLKQSGIWLRIRKRFRGEVLGEFEKKNILFTAIEDSDAVEVQGKVRLDELESFRKGYFEIQDLSSQQTGEYYQPKPNSSWWDACAGSGGKSLLLLEQENSIKLLATDTRENILLNLSERFKKAGIKNYRSKVFNLEHESQSITEMFDGIIVDAPCTGSGTWARSPEWLSNFKSENISEFSERQKKIVGNVVKNLKPNAPLIYITCSVFKKENENNVKYFTDNFNLSLEHSGYFHGYNKRADTLFAVRLIKK
jgi:16S rRNA (cytosine967-C5)-methyltransferase